MSRKLTPIEIETRRLKVAQEFKEHISKYGIIPPRNKMKNLAHYKRVFNADADLVLKYLGLHVRKEILFSTKGPHSFRKQLVVDAQHKNKTNIYMETVQNVLGFENENLKHHDIVDFIDDEFGLVKVLTSSKLQVKNIKHWNFNIRHKNVIDMHILIGFNENRTEIEHVWIFENDNIDFPVSTYIRDNETYLSYFTEYEQDSTPYNTAYQTILSQQMHSKA